MSYWRKAVRFAWDETRLFTPLKGAPSILFALYTAWRGKDMVRWLEASAVLICAYVALTACEFSYRLLVKAPSKLYCEILAEMTRLSALDVPDVRHVRQCLGEFLSVELRLLKTLCGHERLDFGEVMEELVGSGVTTAEFESALEKAQSRGLVQRIVPHVHGDPYWLFLTPNLRKVVEDQLGCSSVGVDRVSAGS
jgi:hypothetical protein